MRYGRHLPMLGVALLVVMALANHSAAAVSSPLTWAQPVRIDHSPPFSQAVSINAVSCPTSNLCAAVDQAGEIITTTDPSDGASAWTSVAVEAQGWLTAVSCSSNSFCAVGDSLGNVFTSTNPSGGAGAWTKAKVDGSAIESISCSSADFCVAGLDKGNVAISTNPAGVAGAWSIVHVDGPEERGILDVSCPSSDLCVAGSAEGRIITSTDPTGGEGAWTVSQVAPAGAVIGDVSCPSERLCVASDDLGEILSSTSPGAGAGAWSAARVEGSGNGYVSCPTAVFCALTGHRGVNFTSADPTGSGTAWTSTPIDVRNASIQDVSCASEAFCALVDSHGDAITSTDPTGGAAAWTITELEIGGSSLLGISCVSTRLCVGVDDAGNVISTTTPAGTQEAWHSAHVDTSKVNGVSCPSAALCVAIDDIGGVLTSTDPTGSASVWTRTDVDGTVPLLGVSCASADLCVATDKEGNVLTSTEPTAGTSAWHIAAVAGENSLGSISCPSISLCVALKGEHPLISTDPSGGPGAWTETFVAVGLSIACPTTSLCVSVRFPKTIVISTDPTGGAGSWHSTQFNGLNGLEEVGCAAGGMCVATSYGGSGSDGNVLVSSDPVAGNWTEANVYGNPIEPPNGMLEFYSPELTGVSCVNEGMCLVVDFRGRAMLGTTGSLPVPPSNLTPPSISGTPEPGQLLCSPGTWSGEPPPTFSYRWLRDGSPIPAAATSTHTVVAADQGHGLACEVTAANSAGSAQATSGSVQVPDAEPSTEPIPVQIPISNNFRILAVKAGENGRILLSLAAPGPGSFLAAVTSAAMTVKAPRSTVKSARKHYTQSACGSTARQPWLWRRLSYEDESATADAIQTTSLILKPRHYSAGVSRSSREVCARLAITFSPRSGMPQTKFRTVVSLVH